MWNRHHRLARSLGGRNTTPKGRNNISVVQLDQHEAFNILFTGNPTPERICSVLNETWVNPDYEVKFISKPKGDSDGQGDDRRHEA